MKSEVINTFRDLSAEYITANRKVREACLDLLKEICNRTPDKEITLTGLKAYCWDFGLPTPTVMYDGGNHPEYACNVFSTVDGFRIYNNNIAFNIEDDSEYYEHRVLTDDLINLCDALIEYEKAGYTLGVNEYSDEE